MSIIKEFREFAMRGNGGGFGSGCHYRSGIREDCIFTGCRYHHMPPLGLLIGGIDF